MKIKFLMVNGVLLSEDGLSPEEIEDMFLDWLEANDLLFCGVTDVASEDE